MTDSLTYVYAVARDPLGEDVEDVEGVGGVPIRLVHEAGLTAVVSTVDGEEFGEQGLRRNLEDLAWLERTVRAHDRVVNAVAAHTAAVPLALATVYFTDDRVRAVLAANASRFGEVLDKIAGRAEWGVKAYAQLDAPAEPAQSEGAAPGTAYLQRLKSRKEGREQAESRALEEAGEVHQALAELAEETHVHPPQNRELAGYQGTMVLNGAYLVPEARADEFAAKVRDIAATATGLRLERTGPWPPYSFAVAPDEAER